MTQPRDYSIQPARAEHLLALPAIELAAAAQFPVEDVPEPLRSTATSLPDFTRACREERLWVALAATGEPVGFAHAGVMGQAAHLLEIDVHPAHGRRGLGRALVERVASWAEAGGFGELTLSTFRDIPWNAPFYARIGFSALSEHDLTPALRRVLEREVELGLERARRVAMRREVHPTAGAPRISYVTKAGVTSASLNELFAAAWPAHRARDFMPVLACSLAFVTAYAGPRLIGFVNVAWDGGEHGFVLDPTVHPEFQRRGIGSQLLAHAIAGARERELSWLHVDYEPRLGRFYERAGFSASAAGVLRL